MVKIKCPNCGRILGDTEKPLNCNFNCRSCKKTVKICIKIANFNDYLQFKPQKEAKWKNHNQEV